ncbi:MAG: hypothetical protein AAGI48_13490 [Verrucomicrobiota bacterium]
MAVVSRTISEPLTPVHVRIEPMSRGVKILIKGKIKSGIGMNAGTIKNPSIEVSPIGRLLAQGRNDKVELVTDFQV